jgi:hypothetical protein
MIYFFNVGYTVTKVPDMRTYQNVQNMLLNFPGCLSIFLFRSSKTDNNALTPFITSNLEKHNLITTKLNAKFPWPSIMAKQGNFKLLDL